MKERPAVALLTTAAAAATLFAWMRRRGRQRARDRQLQQIRTTVVLLEFDLAHCLSRAPWLIKLLSGNDQLGPDEFETDSLHSHFLAVSIAPHIAEGLARLQGHVAYSQRSSGPSIEPLPQKLGGYERLEHTLSGRPERSLHHEFLLSGRGELQSPGIVNNARFDGKRTVLQLSYRITSVIKRLSKHRANRSELAVGSVSELERLARSFAAIPDVEQDAFVRQALDRMTPRARQIVHWRLAGHTWRQIANELGADHITV